nr:hypothetical protein GCM10020092_006730 [Actinoplanes digitatis]
MLSRTRICPSPTQSIASAYEPPLTDVLRSVRTPAPSTMVSASDWRDRSGSSRSTVARPAVTAGSSPVCGAARTNHRTPANSMAPARP